MPTIIDSLIVELGLDPAKFQKGQKESVDALRKIEQEAARSGKQINKEVGVVEQGFGLLQKRMLTVAGLFLGGMGIQQFVQHVTRLNTALGITSQSLGVQAGQLRAWQQGAERLGLPASAATGGFAAITQQRNTWLNEHKPTGLANFQRWNNAQNPRNQLNLFGGKDGQTLRGDEDVMLGLSRWLANETRAGRGPQGQQALQQFGNLPPEAVQLLAQGPEKLQRILAETKKLAPTDAEVKNFQKLNEAMSAASQSADAVGRKVLDVFVPSLTKLFNEIDRWNKYWFGDKETKANVSKGVDKLHGDLNRRFGEPPAWLKNWWSEDTNPSSKKDTWADRWGALNENTNELKDLNKALREKANSLLQKQSYLDDSNFDSGNVIKASWSGGGAQFGGGASWGNSGGAARSSSARSGSVPRADVPSGSGGYGNVGAGKRAVARAVAEEWRKAGMGENGIAGLMANIHDESNFDPGLRHADQPRWSGEAHYAHGLYQEGGAEWNRYDAWLKKNYPGADWKDARLQSRFAAWNLKTHYPHVWAQMQRGSAGQAGAAYVRGYLKPALPYQHSRSSKYLRGVPGVEHYTGPMEDAGAPLPRPDPRGSNQWTDLAEHARFAGMNTGDIRNYRSMTVGDVHIHTAATDSRGIASSIRPALERFADVTSANNGPA